MKLSRKLLYFPVISAVILIIFMINLTVAAFSPTPGTTDHAEVAGGNLSVSDCPPEKERPSGYKQIIQIIDHKFYKWNEYKDPDQNSIYIYQLKPYAKALTSKEAFSLLKASKQWEKQSHQNEITNWPSTELNEIEDNRKIIDQSKTATYPYNNIGLLDVSFPSSYMRSTAFLVSPRLALTNAHNIYSSEIGGWYDKIEFAPGTYEDDWPNKIKPFSTLSPTDVMIDETYFEYENDKDSSVKYDYAALFFDEPFYDISTFIPLEFNHLPAKLSVIGYPGVVQGIDTLDMWQSDGEIIYHNEHLLFYDAYTSGGNSGSPVLAYNQQADTYRVVAIHAFSSPGYFSGGPHFNDQNQAVIEKWIRLGQEQENDQIVSLTLNKDKIILEEGEREALIAEAVSEDNSEPSLVWSSSNPKLAAVDANGVVSAFKSGTATIVVRAVDSGKEASAEVKVKAASNKTIEENTDQDLKPLRGDLNEDDLVNVLDVVLLLQHVLQLDELDENMLERADINKDGVIDVLDATLVMQHALGISDLE